MSQPQSFRLLALWSCSVLTILAAGCQTYPPYGYQGNYNYPMYGQPGYGQPGQVIPYNGPGIVPGGAPLGVQPNGLPPAAYPPAGGAPLFNQGAAAGPPIPNVPVQGVDNSGEFGNQAPFPNVPSSGQSLPPNDPGYSDPTGPSARRPVATPTDVNDPANFSEEINGAKKATDKLKSTEIDVIPNKSVMLDDQFDGVQFTPPINTKASRSAIIQTAQHVDDNPDVRIYGIAKDGHSWFRGVLDYDKQENTWYLIYNPTPALADGFGGMLTLEGHPDLENFAVNDIALVDGSFAPADASGNVKYRVSTIRRLVAP